MSWRSSKTATLLAICLTLFVVLPAFTQGKGHGVEVRAASSGMLEGEPSRILSVSLLTTNKTDREEEFIESLQLPPQWQAVSPASSFVLSAGENRVRVIAILSPANTPAGRYDITYSLHSSTNSEVRDAETIPVHILPVSRLQVLTESKPDSVVAGEQYQVRLRVINQCNYAVKLAVEARSTEHNPVSLKPSQIKLEAGGSEVVSAWVRTNKRLSRPVTDFLQVKVRTVATGGGATTGITVPVDLVPRVSAQPDPYHRIPGRIALQTVDNGGGQSFQAEISGYGPLDRFGTSIDFLLRASDMTRSDFFSQQEEYRLNYHGQNYDLLLGDQSYGLSRLTEASRYGRGVYANVRGMGDLDIELMSMASRWEETERTETGFSIGSQFGSVDANMNFLQKSAGSDDDSLTSIEFSAKPGQNLKIEGEYAHSESSRRDGVAGGAYRLMLDGSKDGIYYSANLIHADSDYYGYYRDCDYSSGSISLPLGNGLRAHLSGRMWEENAAGRSTREDAPSEESYSAGLSYNYRGQNGVSLTMKSFKREDILLPSDYDFRERSLEVGWSRSFGSSSLQAFATWGTQEDLLTRQTRDASRYSLYYHLRASGNNSLSLFTQFGTDQPGGSRLMGGTNTVGLTGRFRLTPRVSLSANYTSNGFDSEYQRINHQAYVTAVYQRDDGSYWTLKLRQFDMAGREGESAFMVSYTTPWLIPVSRRNDMGTLRGRIFDAESTGNPGLGRVVVRAGGASTATGSNGEFAFRDLPPGNYSLSVEQGSIGLDKVTGNKLPLMVEVSAGKTSVVDIPILRASTLVANVSTFTYDTDSSGPSGTLAIQGSGGLTSSSDEKPMVEGGRIQNALLELSNGTETIRGLTDKNGALSLEGLRPGRWHFKIYDCNLPPYHYPESRELDVQLDPGEKQTLVVRVVPRIRPVNIIETGTITSMVPVEK